VTADIATFYRVWLGQIALADALRTQKVQLDGIPADLKTFPRWFTWSPMADTVRAALADQRVGIPISSKRQIPGQRRTTT
jgi:hypothetical protein